MPSKKQIAANRHNANRSTGPRTQSGKSRSRANALRHGLLSNALKDFALAAETEELARRIAREHGKPDHAIEARTIAEAEVTRSQSRCGRSKSLAFSDRQILGIGITSLFSGSKSPIEAQQPSNDGPLPRFGGRIDFECNALPADCGSIDAAGRQRRTRRSKVVKRVVQGLWRADRHRVMLAALVDPRDLDGTPAAPQFHHRGQTVESKLR
jgi:hypothetical protein